VRNECTDLPDWYLEFPQSLRLPSPQPNSDSSPIENIASKLSVSFHQDILQPITDFLEATFVSNTVPIKNLRGGVVRSPKDDTPWSIVLWDEGDDTEIVLITKVAPDEGVYSSILHRSVDTEAKDASRRWKSQLSWILGSAGELGDLLTVGVHVFDLIIKSDNSDLSKSLYDRKKTAVSNDELLGYAMSLLPLFYGIREFEQNFKTGGKF
jgi:hypothetical protein